jgi:pimeloyl-ACP methyl ester carboxylesterase
VSVALAAGVASGASTGSSARTSGGIATAPGALGARVTTYGPSDARRVLVLVPGLGGGGGNFAVIGPELVQRVPNLQVWAVDRRGDALEDGIGFAAGEPGAAYRYYFEGLSLGTSRFDPNRASTTPQARSWGLATNLADLRAVVKRARAGGRRVFLGGHSLGAATTLAYAAWDFAGSPGYRDLAGVVLIDGGQLGTFGRPTLAQANAELAKVTATKPFEDRLGLGVPWLFGVFGQLAAWYALWAPDAPSALAASPLLPASFKPAGPVSNRQFFETSLGQAGISAARCGLDSAARMVGANSPNAFDWYFPSRLKIDLLGAASLSPDPVTRRLGLAARLKHLKAIDVPLYAFATGDIPTTASGARAFLARSSAPRARSLVVSDPTMRHSDPLCTPYERSPFLQTLVAWLGRR